MELIIKETEGELSLTHPYYLFDVGRNQFHSFYISKESATQAHTKYQPSEKEISIADPR